MHILQLMLPFSSPPSPSRKWSARAKMMSFLRQSNLSPKKCPIAVKRNSYCTLPLLPPSSVPGTKLPRAMRLLRPCSRMLQSQRAGRKQLSVMRWESPRDLALLHRKLASRVMPVPDATRSPLLHETGSSTSTSVMTSAGSTPASATTR